MVLPLMFLRRGVCESLSATVWCGVVRSENEALGGSKARIEVYAGWEQHLGAGSVGR
jgi:hypothetical protein